SQEDLMVGKPIFAVALAAAAVATSASASAQTVPKSPDTTNRNAEDQANQANRQIVGDSSQNENEANARNPRPAKPNAADADKKKTDEAAESVGKTTTTAASWVGNEVQDVTRSTERPGHYNPLAVELNPLGLFFGGRVSLNVEWAPVI